MTKPGSPDVKINTFKIRVSNNDLDILHARARAAKMELTQYLRWRGLQPIGQIRKTQERKKLDREAIATYITINKELNRQGINLNQIAKAINSRSLQGKSIDHCLGKIDEIRKINRQILEAIEHLTTNHDC
jgi:alanine racemase